MPKDRHDAARPAQTARRRGHLLLIDLTAIMCVYLTLLGFGLYWYSIVGGGDDSPLLVIFIAWYMAWAFLPKRRTRTWRTLPARKPTGQ